MRDESEGYAYDEGYSDALEDMWKTLRKLANNSRTLTITMEIVDSCRTPEEFLKRYGSDCESAQSSEQPKSG